MGEKKNGKKVKASDVEPGSRLEAMLLSLGETVKEIAARSAEANARSAEAAARSAEANARSAEANARSARAEELAAEALQALLKFVHRTEGRLDAIENTVRRPSPET